MPSVGENKKSRKSDRKRRKEEKYVEKMFSIRKYVNREEILVKEYGACTWEVHKYRGCFREGKNNISRNRWGYICFGSKKKAKRAPASG
jgi:TPP-dependent 2-oxoacid decarboxylase